MSYKEIVDNISNIENLENTTILKILQKFDKAIKNYAETKSGLSNITNLEFSPIENGLTYSNGVADIMGILKFNLENNIIVEKPATIKLNIKGDSLIIVDSDENDNALIVREDDDLYHKIETLSNPNLLINGDFRINQRGKSEYRKQGNTYNVDRWKVYVVDMNSDYIITPNINGGITLDNTNGTGGLTLLQLVEEDYKFFEGKNFSVSAKINGVIYSKSFNIPLQEEAQAIISSLSILNGNSALNVIFDTYRNKFSIEISLYNNTSIVVDYVKLEAGTIYTPYTPRPYGEELALCQRYYQNISVLGVCSGRSSQGNGILSVSLPTTLRTTPTITITEAIAIRGSGIYENISNCEVNALADNLLILNITQEDIQPNNVYMASYGNLSVDSEIY